MHYNLIDDSSIQIQSSQQQLIQNLGFQAYFLPYSQALFHYSLFLPSRSPGLYSRVESGQRVPDPPWIIAVGAISFVSTLFLNFFLLCRTLCAHPQILSIAAMVAILLHIVPVVISTSIYYAILEKGATVSTAFYLSVASAVLSAVTLLLLLLDRCISKRWSRENGSGVSSSQRSLIIFFNSFISMVLIGTISYRYLIPDLTYVDSSYFVIQSILTTGFGDIVPLSTIARVFSLFYLTSGIISFALLVAFLRSTVLEELESQWRNNEAKILVRFKTLSPPTFLSFWKRIFGWEDRSKEGEKHDPIEKEINTRDTVIEEAREENEQELDYQTLVLRLHQEKKRERRSQMAVSLSLFILIWLLGALAYTQLEGWTFFEAFYFCFISFSSVGYGDYAPKTAGGRAFFSFWAILGAGAITVFFSVIADSCSSRFRKTFRRAFLASIIHAMLPKDYICECKSLPNSPSPEPSQPISNSTSSPTADLTATTLLELIEDIMLHLDDVMDSHSSSSQNLERTVREVMDREEFTVSNRELVASDTSLKRFIFLRRLKQKLGKLKDTVENSLEDKESVANEERGEAEARDGEKQVRKDLDEHIEDTNSRQKDEN